MDDRHPLRRWRETHDPPLTQDQAGYRLDVPGNTLARWERCETFPQERYRKRILDVAGVPEDELFSAYSKARPAEAAAQ